MRIIYLITIVLFLFVFMQISCTPNSDFSEDLSGDYFYRDEGKETKDILSHLSGPQEIYSKIIGYDFDSDFIIAAQRPNYEEYKVMIAFNLRNNKKNKYPTNSKEEIIESENEADSLLKHDAFYISIFKSKINYWIISNKVRRVYGPLTKSKFDIERKKLNIPENLQIDYHR